MLVGNKCSLEYARQVSIEEGAAFALSLGCPFVETDGKTMLNFNIAFPNMVRALRAAVSETQPTPRPPSKRDKRKKGCIIS
jgi:hypothetical protein